MKNFMNTVKVVTPSTNVFDLSFDLKTSMKMGYLYPSPPIDCVAGDRIRISTQSLVRFAPLVSPVMHRFNIRHEYWFMPKRLLWKNYEKWATQTEVGGSLPAAPFLRFNQNNLANDAELRILWDHMGLPPGETPGDTTIFERVSAMPFAAYQMIWNDFYRDQNLVAEPAYLAADPGMLIDGNNSAAYTTWAYIRKRAWDKDYFTTCLPFAQKGDPVMIPIGSQEVILKPTWDADGDVPQWFDEDGTQQTGDVSQQAGVPPFFTQVGAVTKKNAYDPDGSLITTDTGEATSINDLRLAYAVQRLKEKLARGGSRFSEFLKIVFGVFPEDSRLDRAEFLGGTKTPLVVSEVLQTSESDSTPQGNMAGHGVGVVNGQQYENYNVKEPGYILCLTSVMPVTSYQQGIHPMWSKLDDPTQEYYPDMANIGEQTVKNREIYAWQAADAGDDDFGYQARFGEYKTMPSFTTGEFRTTLKHWTATRIFASAPALNSAFITADPTTRIFAVEDGVDYIYAHMFHDIKASRKMPKYGTPTH